MIAEWVELVGKNHSAQVGQFESSREDGRGHRLKGGDSEAARQLGLERKDVQRSVKVSLLSAAERLEAKSMTCYYTRTDQNGGT